VVIDPAHAANAESTEIEQPGFAQLRAIAFEQLHGIKQRSHDRLSLRQRIAKSDEKMPIRRGGEALDV
jgi:hypothetical protein